MHYITTIIKHVPDEMLPLTQLKFCVISLMVQKIDLPLFKFVSTEDKFALIQIQQNWLNSFLFLYSEYNWKIGISEYMYIESVGAQRRQWQRVWVSHSSTWEVKASQLEAVKSSAK